jgi:hypothetical protein
MPLWRLNQLRRLKQRRLKRRMPSTTIGPRVLVVRQALWRNLLLLFLPRLDLPMKLRSDILLLP